MDPYRKYLPGQKPPGDAATFSAFSDGAKLARDQRRGLADAAASQIRQGEIVLVKNESGTSLLRGSVLGIDDVIINPADNVDEFLHKVAFRGTTPTTLHAGKYVILLAPIADGSIGRAYVGGACHVKIDVTDEAHTCAEVSSGAFVLASATSGTAQILWKETGTGEKWAIVRFGIPCEGGGEPVGDCACWPIDSIPTTMNYSVEWGYYEIDEVTWHAIGTTSGTMTYNADITYGGTLEDQCNYDAGIITQPTYPGWIGELDFYMANFDVDGNPIDVTLIPACNSYTIHTLTGEGLQTCEVDCCAYIGFLCSGQSFGVETASLVISTYRNEHTCNIGTPDGANCNNEFLYDGDAIYECDPVFNYEVEISVALVAPCIPSDEFGGTGNIRGRLTLSV